MRGAGLLNEVVLGVVDVGPFFLRAGFLVLATVCFFNPHLGIFLISWRIAVQPTCINPINTEGCEMKVIADEGFEKIAGL